MPMFSKEQLIAANGKPYIRAIFTEFSHSGNAPEGHTLLTLSREPKHGYPSLYQIYRKYCDDDPTEFTFAMEVWGSWEHWARICTTNEIKPYIDEWREENKQRQKAKTVKAMFDSMHKGSYQAAKFLYDNGFIEEKPKKHTNKFRGIAKQNALRAQEDDDTSDDAKRLGFTVVK